MELLYFVLKPPLAQRAELRRCVARFGLDGSYAPEKYHCTLLPLGSSGDWTRATLRRLGQALSLFETEPFPVVFDRLDGNLLKGRSGLRAPERFQHALTNKLRVCGFPIPAYRFRLHLSLAYRGGTGRSAKIAPIVWMVEEFELIRSIHGVGHDPLGCWSLRRSQLELDL